MTAFWLQWRLSNTNMRPGFRRMRRAGVGVKGDQTLSGCPGGFFFQHIAPSEPSIKSNNTGLVGTADDG